jgi:hypothetical protein
MITLILYLIMLKVYQKMSLIRFLLNKYLIPFINEVMSLKVRVDKATPIRYFHSYRTVRRYATKAYLLVEASFS